MVQESTQTRVEKRLSIGIPHTDYFTVPWKWTNSLILALENYKGVRNVMFTSCSVISKGRNDLVEAAKTWNSDYLLFIDTDMIFSPNAITEIMETAEKTKADVVCGYFVHGSGTYAPAIYKKGAEKEFEHFTKEELVDITDIHGCGMAFTLLSRKAMGIGRGVFNNIERDLVWHGEDLSFCLRANERGLKMVCDPKIKVGHLRLVDITK